MSNYERWTDEKIHRKALKYKKPAEFKRGDIKAYNVAQQRGILDTVCSHMTKKIDSNFTDIEVVKIAQSFDTKAQLRETYPTLRLIIKRRSLEDIAYKHMTSKRIYKKPDNDTIYLWLAVGIEFNNQQVYKIGVTSYRRGIKRITEVSRKSSIDAVIIEFKRTKSSALKVEKKLLSIGTDPNIKGFRGCTELRALSDAELNQIKEIIEKS